jgi:hypothetical protein
MPGRSSNTKTHRRGSAPREVEKQGQWRRSLVTGLGISDFLQHEGEWGMVRGSSEEKQGGSRPVLTEAMNAMAMATRGKVVSGGLQS